MKSPRCIVHRWTERRRKTTFAREFLPKYADVIHFVNADLIAGGLSPFATSVQRTEAACVRCCSPRRIWNGTLFTTSIMNSRNL